MKKKKKKKKSKKKKKGNEKSDNSSSQSNNCFVCELFVLVVFDNKTKKAFSQTNQFHLNF